MFPLNQNSKLEAFLGSSPASNIQWSVGYIDLPPQTDAATEQQRGNTFPSTSNGTSDVTICPYPGQKSASSSITGGQPAWVRNILYVKGYNPNASAVTATIQINDGNDDIQWTGPIPAGGLVYYEDKHSWSMVGASGQIITGGGVNGPATSTDNAFARWDGAAGNLLQNSSATLDDNGRPTFPTTIGVGNATPSTSGSGISFPATQSASTDANTLDDYEEGTWTPTDASGAALSFSSVTADYEKVGRQFRAGFALTYPATADGSNSLIGGLPFTVANSQGARQGFVSFTDETTLARLLPSANGTTITPFTTAGANITNATLSGNLVYGTALTHV